MHISLILFLVSPFYAVCPSPATLLIIKSFMLALGAFPLHLLTKESLGNDKFWFVLAVTYLLYIPFKESGYKDSASRHQPHQKLASVRICACCLEF